MAKMTSPERLEADIQQILNDYQNHVITQTTVVIEQLAKKGKNAVRRYSRAVINKTRRKYSNGIMYKMDRRLTMAHGTGLYWANQVRGATIYAGKQPGLSHLLEHGHAVVSGGRSYSPTKERPHWKPVEDQLVNEAVRKVIQAI